MNDLLTGLTLPQGGLYVVALWVITVVFLMWPAKVIAPWVAGVLIVAASAYPLYGYRQALVPSDQTMWLYMVVGTVVLGLILIVLGFVLPRRKT